MSKLMSRRPSRSRTSTPRIAGLVGVLGGLAAGAAAVARRRSSGAAAGDGASSPASAERPAPGSPPSEAPAAAAVAQETYTCECGAAYRVSGQDRHRVYWPEDADAGEPVLGQACPQCERPLPHDHAAAT
jgi:hypothetical protein